VAAAAWLSGNGIAHTKVILRRARFVLGWVTVSVFNSWLVQNIYLGMWPATEVNSAWPSLRG